MKTNKDNTKEEKLIKVNNPIKSQIRAYVRVCLCLRVHACGCACVRAHVQITKKWITNYLNKSKNQLFDLPI